MTAIPEDVWTRIAQMVERLADEHEASSHTQEEKAGFLFDAIAALILSEREAAQREERERLSAMLKDDDLMERVHFAAAILQEPKE